MWCTFFHIPLLGQYFDFSCRIAKHMHKHAFMQTCTHNRKLPPSSNDLMQITNMQIGAVKAQLSCDAFWRKHHKSGRGAESLRLGFNLYRQRNSLIPTLTAFPPQCPAFSPFCHPLLASPALRVETTGAHKCKPLGGKCSLTALWCVCDWSVSNEGVPWTTCRADSTAGHQHQTQIRVGRDHAEQQGT